MGIDDFLKQVQEDEDNDRVEDQTHATPIDYARSRSKPGNTLAPQRVYYALRNHKLDDYTCQCGRRVISIEEADEYFGFKKEPEEVPDADTSDELEDV
jgi:hypothetical protein